MQPLMLPQFAELVGKLRREQLHHRASTERHFRAPCRQRAATGDDDGFAANIQEDGKVIQGRRPLTCMFFI
jgi:hypothetical protein